MLYVDEYGLFAESLQEFEWGRRFQECYSSLEATFSETWSDPRFQGSMQALGGIAEASMGAAMTFASQGAAAPIGWGVMAHGLDHFFTGINTLFSGTNTDSVTSQLLQTGGLSSGSAHLIDSAMSFTSAVAGAGFAISSTPFKPVVKSVGKLMTQEAESLNIS